MAALRLVRSTNEALLNKCYDFTIRKAFKRNGTHNRRKHTECTVELKVGERIMKFSTGKMAKLADGAVLAEYGNNAALVTAVSSGTSPEQHGLPLIVDYREKAAAGGLIPSTFLRRDHIALERDILISRCIDRSLRPLFPKGYSYKTQVISTLLAADGICNPDITGMNGASAALAVSDIPWSGPIGVVRIGEIDGELVVNPTWSQLSVSYLDLVIACSKTKVVMVEAFAKEVSTEMFCQAIRFGFKECQPIIKALTEMQEQAGKVKRMFVSPTPSSELLEAVQRFSADRFDEIFSNFSYNKTERDQVIFSLIDECIENVKGDFPDVDEHIINDAVRATSRAVFRRNVLQKSQRCDGRPFNDLRPISCEVDLFQSLHGSAMFQRGQTQVFCTASIGSQQSSKKPNSTAEAVGDGKEKKFMLHYEFPPFCVGEVGALRGNSRRELGHGNLAERSLGAVIPEDFPFAVRLVSQVLESNGSSSLASACAGSLALMDAGVPITRPVGGSACGLITSSDAEDPNKPDIEQYQLLTDILGIEDYMGDMDFKLAGTKEGITGLQADLKIPGLPLHIVEEAVRKGTEDRMKVLDVMAECQSEPRASPKRNTPVQMDIFVPQAKCGKLLGYGGFTIRNIQDETGASIVRVEDERFSVFAPNSESLQKTIERVNGLLIEQDWTLSLEAGTAYAAVIVEVRDYGVLVELLPDTPTVLLHVSEMAHNKVFHPKELEMKEGDTVQVKYLGKDPRTGRVLISRKALLPRGFPFASNHSKTTSETEKHDDFVSTFLK